MLAVARCMLLVVGVLACSSARGDERDEARSHSDRARSAFERSDYPTALGEFQQAYDLAPVPELLYNMARCHAEIGQPAEAAAAYRKYLAAKPNAEDRADVEARIRELESQAKRVAASPAPASSMALTAPAPAPAKRWYRKWWPWTILGVGVAAVAATATGIALSSSSSSNFPAIQVNR